VALKAGSIAGRKPLGMIALQALIGGPRRFSGPLNHSCGPSVFRYGGNSYRKQAWSFVSCLAHSC
jgi:hypothetical protein